MSSLRRYSFRVLGLGLVLLLSGVFAGASKPLAPMLPAPDFSLTDLLGNQHKLADYKDKVLIVDFWATWCGPCLKEIPNLVALQHRYEIKGLRILGISMDDDAGPVKRFAATHKMNYPLIMSDLKVTKAFGGILGLPILFVIDKTGKLVARHVGLIDKKLLEKEIKGLL